MIASQQDEKESEVKLAGPICPICGSKTEVRDGNGLRVRRCRRCGYTERYRRAL